MILSLAKMNYFNLWISFMSDQYTEEEDKLVSWFKDNSRNMIIGIIVGALSVLSYNYYSDSNLNKQYNISLKYEEALINYQDNKYDKILSLSDELNTSDPSNIYTSLANLYAGKIHHDNQNYTFYHYLSFVDEIVFYHPLI